MVAYIKGRLDVIPQLISYHNTYMCLNTVKMPFVIQIWIEMKGKKCVVIIHFILRLAYFGVKIEWNKILFKTKEKTLTIH